MGVLERISSFAKWPMNSSTSPLTLANAGFMYTGERDKVRCPICRLEVAEWSEDAQAATRPNPRNQHRIQSPDCPLALECSKPDSEIFTAVRNKILRRNTISSFDEEVVTLTQTACQKPSTENVRSVLLHALDRATKQSADGDGRCDVTWTGPPTAAAAAAAAVGVGVVVDRTNTSLDERLKLESIRLGTFHDWPTRSAPVKPEVLAADGFFYTGQGDRVCCAFCRGVLHRWVRGDEPSVEHRRHFPDCPFVRGQNVGNVPAAAASSGELSLRAGPESYATATETRRDEKIVENVNITTTTTADNNNLAVVVPAIDRTGQQQTLQQQQQQTNEKTNLKAAEDQLPADDEDDEEQRLLVENQQLVETITCKVCLDRAVNTVFLPCGHLVVCDECSPRLRNCPICRTYIRGTVKTFFS